MTDHANATRREFLQTTAAAAGAVALGAGDAGAQAGKGLPTRPLGKIV